MALPSAERIDGLKSMDDLTQTHIDLTFKKTLARPVSPDLTSRYQRLRPQASPFFAALTKMKISTTMSSPDDHSLLASHEPTTVRTSNNS